MKKILSVLLIVTMLIPFASFGSFAASDAYKATWTLKASVYDAASSEANDKTNFTKGGATVYDSKNTSNVTVKPGQVVWITVHLKTGSSYYAGELSNLVFYTNNIFKSSAKANYVWNTKGKYTGICTRNGTSYANAVDSFKKNAYPSSWSAAKKSENEFYTIFMYPDVATYSKTVANVDEDLVSFPIYVKSDAKAGSTGEIYITQDILATTSNKTGKFYLNYFENGDLSKNSVTYSKNVTHDTSKAKITFTVAGGSSDPQPAQSGIAAFFAAIANFFKSIVNFFKGLFS